MSDYMAMAVYSRRGTRTDYLLLVIDPWKGIQRALPYSRVEPVNAVLKEYAGPMPVLGNMLQITPAQRKALLAEFGPAVTRPPVAIPTSAPPRGARGSSSSRGGVK
jgi:hypothetical protein